MDSIALLEPLERAQLFEDATVQLGTIQEPGFIEKDFWVCWVLDRLFRPESPYPTLLFKGGTSLSKGFGSIHRFSEDVDLAFDRSQWGFTEDRDPLEAISRKRAKALVDELKLVCTEYVQGNLLQLITKDFSDLLGDPGAYWALTVAANDEDGQTLLFRYPTTRISMADGAYVLPEVRLEFGARSDHWPVLQRKITPYAAVAFPEAFPEARCSVRTLAIERSFWEKATILHAHFHGGVEKIRPRVSRHYYDVSQLALGSHRVAALGRVDLLAAVVRHKSRFFPSAWAKYEEARPGALRLVPPQEVIEVLRPDYAQMSVMFFAEQPDFQEILDSLSDLEGEINGS